MGRNPVRQSLLTVLNDGFAGVVAVIGGARLARRHRSVIDEIEEMFSVTGNDGSLLTVFTESVELICVRGFELLSSNVGQLGFGDKRLRLCAN